MRAGDVRPRVLFVGDMHVGSEDALAPAYRVVTPQQGALLTAWQDMVELAGIMAGEAPLVLALGGDLIDGHHHNTYRGWGTLKEQRECAVELLTPLLNVASAVIALPGTEAHAGEDGEDDRTAAEMCGAQMIDQRLLVQIGDCRLDWSHHGISVSPDPNADDNGLILTIRRVEARCLRESMEKPDLIVSHHIHYAPKPVTMRGITAAICPAWQLRTPFGARAGVRRRVDIGVLYWDTATLTVDRWLWLEGREREYRPVVLRQPAKRA